MCIPRMVINHSAYLLIVDMHQYSILYFSDKCMFIFISKKKKKKGRQAAFSEKQSLYSFVSVLSKAISPFPFSAPFCGLFLCLTSQA